jgi:hypothetical protein
VEGVIVLLLIGAWILGSIATAAFLGRFLAGTSDGR